jgi:hypothetical protein
LVLAKKIPHLIWILPQDLVASDKTHLSNSMRVPEDDTDLGWSHTFLGQLEDLILDLVTSQLEPVWNRTTIRQSRLGNTLTGSVHTTHGSEIIKMVREKFVKKTNLGKQYSNQSTERFKKLLESGD